MTKIVESRSERGVEMVLIVAVGEIHEIRNVGCQENVLGYSNVQYYPLFEVDLGSLKGKSQAGLP